MSASVRTLCRCCSAACGIVVDVERGSGEAGTDRVLRVRGDGANPRSRGYLCSKGASLPEFHHRATRLEQPRLLGRSATWAETLDDLAARLDRLRRTLGPDAIALYQGTGAVSDSLALPAIARFMAGLGTRQLYTAATVDVAPALRAGELVCGFAQPWPVWVPEDPANRFALLIGFNPALSHGYLTLLPNASERLRAHRARGGALWVVDPRRTRTARLADRHLAPRPGSDAILLAWLVREALAANAHDAELERRTDAADRARLARVLEALRLERVVAETGLPGEAIEDLTRAIARAGRIAVVAGTGITLGRDALLCEWLRWALLIATDSLDREGGMWFNPGVLARLEETGLPIAPPEGWLEPGPRSRPELPRLLDQQPCVALVDEIEAGYVRALFVAGSSPLTAFPEPERMRRALARLEALVVLDVVETPLTAMATHVLPATGQLERADLVVETQAAIAPSVVPPVGERRPMWWMLAELGARLGFDALGEGLVAERTRDEDLIARMAASARGGAEALLAAGPDGIDPPRLWGWVRERVLPEGRFRLVPPGLLERLRERLARPPATAPFVLVAARQPTRTNATPYMSPTRSPDTPSLHVHPDDARSLGLAARDAVELTSAFGKLVAPLALDRELQPGVVCLSHGWPETNVCALTSSSDEIDPLTGQPAMTGIAVRLARVAGGGPDPMSGPDAAYNFALALGSGVAAHVVARHLHLPSIVVLLATGVALGPDGLGWISPDALGDGLPAFVSLAVAVILFEGGLGLDLQRLRAAATPVRRLVTWGALVTLFGAAIAAQLILGWPPDRALLYGSLVIVTGPTVVRPLLRLVPVHNRLSTVLEAEGLLIDPVGAIVAAVALEVVVQRTLGSFASGALGLVSRLAFGAGAGLAIGGNLAMLLRSPRLVPAGLENLVVLGGGLAGFALCEAFLPESGILAVVVAAAVLANLAPQRARAVGEFQEQLTLGLIGMLFVLLAADVRLATVLALGWPGVATVAALAFVVRPIGVFWCTRGSELSIRERLFAAWLGPRGVVAAAIASVTATTLDAVGVPGGPELRALVFLSIALSVVVLGGLAPVAAWALRVRSPGRTMTVILGADELPLVLGEILREGGQSILFTDKNPDCCRAAEQRGFAVVFGDALSPTTLARLRLERAKTAIGLTTNTQLNHVFTLEAQEEYDVPDLYVAAARREAEESARLARRHAVRVLFDRPKDVERWNVRLRHQQTERVRLRALPPGRPAGEKPGSEPPAPPSIATPATAPAARAAAETTSPDTFVILAVRRGHWQPMHESWAPKTGDEAIALIHRDESLSARATLLALGWQLVDAEGKQDTGRAAARAKADGLA